MRASYQKRTTGHHISQYSRPKSDTFVVPSSTTKRIGFRDPNSGSLDDDGAINVVVRDWIIQ